MSTGDTSGGKRLALNADVIADILAATRESPSWKTCQIEGTNWAGTAEEKYREIRLIYWQTRSLIFDFFCIFETTGSWRQVESRIGRWFRRGRRKRRTEEEEVRAGGMKTWKTEDDARWQPTIPSKDATARRDMSRKLERKWGLIRQRTLYRCRGLWFCLLPVELQAISIWTNLYVIQWVFRCIQCRQISWWPFIIKNRS